MFESSLYLKSPRWMQESFLSARSYARKLLREGSAFKKEMADVTRTQWLNPEAMDQLQLDRLQHVVSHAVRKLS